MRRSGVSLVYENRTQKLLSEFADVNKSYVASRLQASLRQFERRNSPSPNETTVIQTEIEIFDQLWADQVRKIGAIPGKDALSAINTRLQVDFEVGVTPTAIIDSMRVDEVPAKLRLLVQSLATFVATAPQRNP